MDTSEPPEHVGCKMSGKWYVRRECQQFSVDGSAMGATIAHLYGTTDTKIIDMIQEAEMRADKVKHLTGMDEEQRDWEEGGDDDDGDC